MAWYRKPSNVPVRHQSGDFRDDFFGLVDGFFKDWGLPSNDLADYSQKLTPRMNVSETDSGYQIETELPGVDKNHIQVDLHNNVLTIKGEKKGFNEEKKDKYHRIERSHGSFMRSVHLPNDIDSEKVTAQVENGVLHVEVAKQEKSKDSKRTISIK